jgi:hypothetical protein
MIAGTARSIAGRLATGQEKEKIQYLIATEVTEDTEGKETEKSQRKY